MKKRDAVDEPRSEEQEENDVSATAHAKADRYAAIKAAEHIKNDIYNTNIVANRYGFFFDYKNFLLNHVTYPGLIHNMSKKISDKAFKGCSLFAAKVTRTRIDGDAHKNKLEEEVIADSFTSKPSKDYFKVHARIISNLPELIFMEGIDVGIAYKTYGKYRYKVYIEAIDGTVREMERLYGEGLSLIKNLEHDLIIASKPILDSERIIDSNPHIDNIRENEPERLTKGYYITDEDIFDDSLANFLPFTEQFITSRLEYLKNLLLVIYTANIVYKKDVVHKRMLDINKIIENIRLSISPGTGNPDGVKAFIDTIRSALERLKELDVGFKPSYNAEHGDDIYPNSAKYIKDEHTFINSFDVERNKKVGFQYFDLIDDGVGLARVSKEYISTAYEGYQHLANIVLPYDTKVSTLDIRGNLGLVERSQILFSYNALDVILSSANSPNYENMAFGGIAHALDSNSSAAEVSVDLIYRLLSDTSFLSNQNITVQLAYTGEDSKPAEAGRLSLQVSKLQERILQRRLEVGILNTAKRIYNKEISAYYSRLIKYKMSPGDFSFIKPSDIGPDILDSSLLKVKYETASKMYGITFSKKQDDTYNLNSVILLEQSEMSPLLEYLCELKRYTNSSIGLLEPVFPAVPTLNKFFIKSAVATAVRTAK